MARDRAERARAEPGDPHGPAAAGGDGVARTRVYLQGGEVFTSAEPASVVTILGSCVSVCLFDPGARVGGVNHFLLPFAVTRERSPRFGNVALAHLLDEVLRRGARRGALRAKVFGGSGAMHGVRHGGRSLGESNVELALRTLAEEQIPVVDGDVGGSRGRKLVFHVDDGSAWVRIL